MLNEKIRQLIQAKFNSPLAYPQQCEALAMAIHESTGQTLGTTTLKRMLGFVGGTSAQRRSSLDIIAQYLGYSNYDALAKDVGDDMLISEFKEIESLDSADLEPGEQIRITYDPKRELVLSYMGNNIYTVMESHRSKLLEGDKLSIAGFYVGFELLVSDVERDRVHLGSYQAAKQGGLTSVEIL